MSDPLEGISNSKDTAGVVGINTDPSDGRGVGVSATAETGEAVLALTNSPNFAAVSGFQHNSDSKGAGVFGESLGTNPGLWGHAAGDGAAVFGQADGNGAGVLGNAQGNGAGVKGINNNLSSEIRGVGVWGISETGEGLFGETTSLGFAAVSGFQQNPASIGAGVYGQSLGANPGVNGVAMGSAGIGVLGKGLRAGRFEGDVEVTGDIRVTGDILLTGGDCSEHFDIAGAESCAPGSVMIIDDEGVLAPSSREYDTRVAGIVAGAGDLRPGLILGHQGAILGRLPIALVGTVFCQAAADEAPIAVGDLLTTSSVRGYAMKARDRSRAIGAILGKALQPLTSGTGLIRILIALQ
jgi:hypothetical protein